MRKIDPYQIKKMYAMAGALGMTEAGSHEDGLHLLVAGMTGKESVKALTYREAQAVIGRLKELQGGQAPQRAQKARAHPSRPGGVTSGQQKKIWALMYELQKYDTEPSTASLGDRLCAVIKKELKVDAIARTPFAWLDYQAGNHLIEVLKGYVKTEGKKVGRHDRAG